MFPCRKYRVVLDEITSGSPDLVQPIKMLANFLANPAARDDMVADLDAKVKQEMFILPPSRLLVIEENVREVLSEI